MLEKVCACLCLCEGEACCNEGGPRTTVKLVKKNRKLFFFFDFFFSLLRSHSLHNCYAWPMLGKVCACVCLCEVDEGVADEGGYAAAQCR